MDIPKIGTIEYNTLKPNKLILDMENRFKNGEIRKLSDYVKLLKDHECNEARMKTLEKYPLFERAMNFCMVDAEKNLVH